MQANGDLSQARNHHVPPPPLSPEERELFRGQLERLLEEPLFKHSRRYPSLLRYIVENALSGHIERLKERVLGVEVFGRPPDYDTSTDPVVRITAAEIRKRLAQYYYEDSHRAEPRIELPAGSYIPEFRMPEKEPSAAATPSEVLPTGSSAWRRKAALVAFPAAGVGLLGLMLWTATHPEPALDAFWRPLWDSDEPVTICVSDLAPRAPQAASAAEQITAPPQQDTIAALQRRERTAFSDAVTLARLAGLLQSRSKRYQIRGASSTTLSDLRGGPAVLIGGFNNPWTIRLTSSARYAFERDSAVPAVRYILDRQKPSFRGWLVDGSVPLNQFQADYALISRLFDPTTEKPVVIAAGITKFGTMAAGEFLSSREYMEQIRGWLPGGWEKKSLQLVIATRVVGGSIGPPRLVAAHSW